MGTSWQRADVLGGGKVRSGADPVLVGVGMGSLCGERTKGGSLHGASWLGADRFFLCVVRMGSSTSGRAAGAGYPSASST